MKLRHIALGLCSLASTLLAVTVIAFVLLVAGPDPRDQMLTNPEYTPADISRISEANGWDKPIVVQYLTWLGNLAHGDLGISTGDGRAASTVIGERLGLSLVLMVCAELLALMVAIPIAMRAAHRHNSRFDHSVEFAASTILSLPGFVIAMMLQLLAVVIFRTTGHLPVFASGAPIDNAGGFEFLQRMLLPICALATAQMALWIRFERAEFLNVLQMDFVLNARARGLPPLRVLTNHVLPNVLVPLVTIVSLDLAMLFGGSVIVETVFGIPGVGSLLLESVLNRDTVVALDIVALSAIAIVLAQYVATLAGARVDPRQKQAGQ